MVGRQYPTPIGPLPSVTTIIGAMDNKIGVEKWKEKTPNWQEELNKSITIGNALHKSIEYYIKKKRKPQIYNKQVYRMFNILSYYLDRRNIELSDSEVFVYSTKRYAGTIDILGSWYGQNLLLDLKTSKKVHTNHKMQVIAYKKAYEELYGEKIDFVGILRLNKLDTKPQLYIIKEDKQEKLWDLFLKFRRGFDFLYD